MRNRRNARIVDPATTMDALDHVTAQIRRAINDGEAEPGERLPPAQDLAAELGVGTDIVLRSLHILLNEGFVEPRF